MKPKKKKERRQAKTKTKLKIQGGSRLAYRSSSSSSATRTRRDRHRGMVDNIMMASLAKERRGYEGINIILLHPSTPLPELPLSPRLRTPLLLLLLLLLLARDPSSPQLCLALSLFLPRIQERVSLFPIISALGIVFLTRAGSFYCVFSR